MTGREPGNVVWPKTGFFSLALERPYSTEEGDQSVSWRALSIVIKLEQIL